MSESTNWRSKRWHRRQIILIIIYFLKSEPRVNDYVPEFLDFSVSSMSFSDTPHWPHRFIRSFKSVCKSGRISKLCWMLDTYQITGWLSDWVAGFTWFAGFVLLVCPSRSLHTYISLLRTHSTRHVQILNIHNSIIAFYTFSFQLNHSQFPLTIFTTLLTQNILSVSLKHFLYEGTLSGMFMLLVFWCLWSFLVRLIHV